MSHFRALLLSISLLFLTGSAAHATDLLIAPASTAGSPVDSAGILESALEARGRAVVRSSAILGVDLGAFEAVWVCLGVSPFTHPLSFTEGVRLKEYLEAGGTLYLEGGDVWGYDILTPLNIVDGITASADGGNDLFAIEGVVGENGSDWSGFAASYSGENTHLDHLYADRPGASIVLRRAGNGYGVGVLHVGAQSGLADFHSLGVSFEFGGVDGDRDALLEEILIALDLEPDCRSEAPTTPSCAPVHQRVELTWQNLASYASLEVLRNDLVIAALPPTVSTYVDVTPPGGPVTYSVRASGGEECSWLSEACTVDVPVPAQFRRGDTNQSAHVNLTDAVRLLAALFVPDSLLACPDAGDVNDNGSVDISDAILLLRFIFEDGLPPHSPGLDCGVDPTADTLATCDGACTP